jgi:hypothetical protein
MDRMRTPQLLRLELPKADPRGHSPDAPGVVVVLAASKSAAKILSDLKKE